MKNLLYNCGIDTVCLLVNTKYSDEEIHTLKAKNPVLKIINKVSLTNDQMYKIIVFQPSNYIDPSRLINDGSLFSQCINQSLKILEGEVVSVNRIDISVDSKKELNDYKQLARLIVLCVAANKNIRKAFTVKNLFDLKEKTVKLDSDRFVATFYCRKDKELHNAASRFEIRYKRLSQAQLGVEAKKRIKRTIDLFSEVESGLEKVEKIIIPVLVNCYLEEISSGIIATFSGFLDKYGEFVYTKQMFDEIYKKCGLKGAANSWLKKFRKNRPNALKFKSKKSIKNFSAEVNKHLKQYMKTL